MEGQTRHDDSLSSEGRYRLLVEAFAAEEALHYVAPVGEKADYVTRAMAAVRPFLAEENLARIA